MTLMNLQKRILLLLSLTGHAAEEMNATSPAGEWNHMKVAGTGKRVSVALNGKHVNEAAFTHPRLRQKPWLGFIGFQDHGLPFSWRNIHMRSLVPSSQP